MSNTYNSQDPLYADFEREAVPHMDALHNFALRLTGDEDDANDLLQETYLRAFRFFDKFEKGTNCKAWLFRIMKNSYINAYQKKKKTPVQLDYEEVEKYYENVKPSNPDDAHLTSDTFESLLDDEVSQAIAKLPEDFRTVIILTDIEGFTYEEVAEFVDCPIGTVRSRLHRARKMLYTELQGYAQERGYLKSDERIA
ncbi:MAG: sigma-70 family RNA polymerase sigma factor [Ignavibacteriaceae bacterium]|nr:sigma-70 family RNA polymerase sigma factor [Ignavibacteriaceae bacterium]